MRSVGNRSLSGFGYPLQTVDVVLDVDPLASVVGGAVTAFLTTLVVGAVLVAVLPAYADRIGDAVGAEPLNSFLYGIFVLLALAVLVVALVFSVLGIVVAVPLVLAAYVVWAVGSAVAFLVVGRRLVDDEDWWRPLAVGAAINGGLTLPAVGGIVAICIGAAGFGAVMRDWLGD